MLYGRRKLVAATIALGTLVAATHHCIAASNLLVNGGFEIPATAFQSIYPGTEPAGFGWKVTQGDIEVSQSNGPRDIFFPAFEGLRVVDSSGVSAGRFSQDIATIPGTTYSVMFAYSNNPFWPPATLLFDVTDGQSQDSLASGSVSHGSATIGNADWDYLSPLSFTAAAYTTRLEFISQANGAGGVILDDVQVFEGVIRTLGSIPAYAAMPDDNAFILGATGIPSGGGGGIMFEYLNLDLLGDAVYELLPLDTLCLDNGNGTLFVGPGATFISNGVIKGNVANSGLVIIPITKVRGSLPKIVAPPVGSAGGAVIVKSPEVPPQPSPPPVIIQGPEVRYTVAPSTGFFIGGSGGFSGNVTAPPAPPAPIVWQGDSPIIEGTVAWDAKLEVTGSWTQTETGVMRVYIAGEEQGVSYSQLAVGQGVTLDGTIQVVLRPELFDYEPRVGDFFDIVTSPVGILLADGDLQIDTLVTSEGASLLSSLWRPIVGFSSRFAGDPDSLADILSDLFVYSIVDDGKTLRLTVAPEPTAFTIVVLGALAVSHRRS